MKFENIRGIIWDLDGTLLNSFGIFNQIINELAVERGQEMPSTEMLMENYHGSLEEAVGRALQIESAEELLEVSAEFLKKQQKHYQGDIETHLYMDAANLAKQAAELSIHQILVTNRAHEGRGSASPRFIIAATFLSDLIHEVYPSDEIAFRKPDSRSVSHWMVRNNLKPEETLVIGDQFVDAQLAINIGARAILIKRDIAIPHLDQFSKSEQQHIFVTDSLEKIELL